MPSRTQTDGPAPTSPTPLRLALVLSRCEQALLRTDGTSGELVTGTKVGRAWTSPVFGIAALQAELGRAGGGRTVGLGAQEQPEFTKALTILITDAPDSLIKHGRTR